MPRLAFGVLAKHITQLVDFIIIASVVVHEVCQSVYLMLNDCRFPTG